MDLLSSGATNRQRQVEEMMETSDIDSVTEPSILGVRNNEEVSQVSVGRYYSWPKIILEPVDQSNLIK